MGRNQLAYIYTLEIYMYKVYAIYWPIYKAYQCIPSQHVYGHLKIKIIKTNVSIKLKYWAFTKQNIQNM